MEYRWGELIAVLALVISIISLSLIVTNFYNIKKANEAALKRYNERINKK